MAKKSFINPALQFISTQQTDAQAAVPEQMPQNVAPAESNAPTKTAQVETRSKRVNLLFQPSLWAKIQQKAKAEGISANELIHREMTRLFE